MAHVRDRHLKHLIEKSLRFSPIVGILGHRQVGKTTLTSSVANQYVTLDGVEDLAEAMVDPRLFLSRHPGDPSAIDECQLAPPLFPAIKEWVRIHKKPGQFLLTGSVRFTSRKAIRESLTGRIITWELLPMDWSEQNQAPLPDSLIRLLDAEQVSVALPLPTRGRLNDGGFRRYLEMGGLPGVFGVRDPAIRAQRFETQINTILERDLRLLIQTTLSYRSLRQLVSVLAKKSGLPFSITDVARETRITPPTLRKLLAAFEALFLLRFVPAEGDFGKAVLFFEDLGERNYLTSTALPDSQQLLFFLYQNLRVQAHYRPELKIETFCFRSRSGHHVPLCFRKGANVMGLIPVTTESELGRAHVDARHFLKRYSRSKVLVVSVEDCDQVLDPNIRRIGVGRLV